MNFGQALEALKLGQLVARDGWNGKGMYIYLERLQRIHDGTVIEFEPCIVLYNAQGQRQPGWAPSQADMLADDWSVLDATAEGFRPQEQSVLRVARDLYATYCASSGGKNYQGLPCPAWDALTEAVRGHWCTVALRVAVFLALAGRADAFGRDALVHWPTGHEFGRLPDFDVARRTWHEYAGVQPPIALA